MTCLRPERMDLYIEGELEEAERREVEEHLGLCPACRRELEDRRVLNGAFSSLPPIDVPADFAAAVMAKLPAERRAAFGRLGSVVAAAVVVCAGLLGYHLVTGESLAGVLAAAGRTVMGFISLAAPLLAKAFKLVRVFLTVAQDLGTALLHSLGAMSSLLRPEVVGFALLAGLLLALLGAFGLKKIVSLGEKS